MLDRDLLLSMAEIAGVFVGFGALVAVRTGATMDPTEVNTIRWPVTIGIWVVIAALSPTIIGSYGVGGHELWLASSLLALVLLVVMIVVFGRAPENRADVVETLASTPRASLVVGVATTFWLPVALLLLTLVLVVLGGFPDREQALYITAVGMGLYMGAMGLFVAVFWQRRPSRTADPSVPPAGGR